MTTYLERATIQRDAQQNPFVEGYVAPTDTSTPAVTAAVNFSKRLQSAMEDVALDIIKSGSPENDSLVWAQKIVGGQIDATRTALRLVLAEFDSTTPADLATVTDAQMKTFLASVVPILAAGIRR